MVTDHETGQCSLPDCFCHEAQGLESKSSPVEQESQKPTIDPYEYLKTFKYPPEQTTPDCPDSPALRRGRSILHHAEMVEEQVRRDNCGECSHAKDLHNGDHCWYPLPSRSGVKWCDCKCVFPVEQPPAQMTFDQHWQSAPKSIKHGCEEASAEFFYYAGRRDRETEMLREVNEVLSGVVGRIERERITK